MKRICPKRTVPVSQGSSELLSIAEHSTGRRKQGESQIRHARKLTGVIVELELDRDTAHLLESNPSVGVSAIKMAVQRSQDNRDSPHYPHRFRRDDDGRDEIPFDDTTLFYENISTERGRRQMSDFPMVRVFCNALQLAGYRAEMDDEGDIWYDADDGDRYHDAREYQPGPGKDNGVVADCAICRDPEKHGLGYILRRAEAGERFITEFWERDKGKHKSRF